MYDIRQLRPSLYILLAMGITGFGLAMQTPGLWMLALGGLLFNAWLLKTGRFVPMPRLLATAVTLAALAYTVSEIRDGGTPLIIVGEFLVLLHLVKLYEQRGNRDYAQLLVLSLLLMAAASISTAQLLFGVLLVAYLFLALHCCLLLHLKMESDAALASLNQPKEKANLASIRQDQRRLSASMRFLTAVISIFSIVMGVLVFVFFPRGAGDVLFGRRAWTPPPVLTGFADEVSYQQPTQILSNNEIVARVHVMRDGKPWGGVGPLLLRGATLDVYTGDGQDNLVGLSDGTVSRGRPDPQQLEAIQPWQWRRSSSSPIEEFHCQPGVENMIHQFSFPGMPASSFEQEVTLEPASTNYLFAMAGAFKLKSGQSIGGVFYPRDSVVVTDESTDRGMPLRYTVWSLGFAPVMDELEVGRRSRIDPLIDAYARRPEVSGVDDQGRPLATLRETADAPQNIDRLIAASIERHLRTQFQYSVNLPAEVSKEVAEKLADSNRDPIVTFLYDAKRGHCEYFAGAMTLLCQSLGMQARMVVGYRSDEFNTMGQFYIVRQNQAHAWVEVLTPAGWEAFDPTSSNEAITTGEQGWIGQAKSLFNYLEYEWGITVIAYGQDNRKNVVEAMNLAVTRTAVTGSQLPFNLHNQLSKLENPTLLGGLMTALILAILCTVAYFVYERIRLRLRARRMGLKGLPAGQQDRLARQLAFYADLLQVLGRRGINFPDHLTPLEFSGSLSYLPNQTYNDIRRLTEIFYRIRYGHSQINGNRRRRLAMIIAQIDRSLGKQRASWFG
jgi:protein-glutamine gamma-glutamyltransferase